jgi:hypothetical protein
MAGKHYTRGDQTFQKFLSDDWNGLSKPKQARLQWASSAVDQAAVYRSVVFHHYKI